MELKKAVKSYVARRIDATTRGGTYFERRERPGPIKFLLDFVPIVLALLIGRLLLKGMGRPVPSPF